MCSGCLGGGDGVQWTGGVGRWAQLSPSCLRECAWQEKEFSVFSLLPSPASPGDQGVAPRAAGVYEQGIGKSPVVPP